MTQKRRQFFPEERMQALRLAEEIGVTRACKELGVARSSVHRWQREALSPRSVRRHHGRPGTAELQNRATGTGTPSPPTGRTATG